MSSLTIHLKPSRQLVSILIVAHCSAALLVCTLSLSSDIKLIGFLSLIISLYFYLKHDALLDSANSVTSLSFSDTVDCKLKMVSGQTVECSVSGSTFVSSYLTVLILHSKQWRLARSVVILNDAINREEFRRLRVMLRWKWKQVSK
ncbi:MAG: protein YgfX [Nitrosomonas sp.]